MSTDIWPVSRIPITAGKVQPRIHFGATNSRAIEGMGVMASLDGNAAWHVLFPRMPNPLPAGTPTLVVRALANATTGVARVNPSWASFAVEETYDTLTLNAEGVQSVTWASGDADQFKEATFTLDADTVVAGEMIFLSLGFETSSWTLAAASTWLAFITWV